MDVHITCVKTRLIPVFAGDIILTFVHLTITNTRFLQRLRVLAQKVPDIAVRISFLFSLSDFQTIDIDKVMLQFM